MTALQMILTGAIWLAGLNGLFLLFSPYFAPALFLKYSAFGFGPPGSGEMPLWGMPFGLFGVLSIGRVIYCALYSITFAIPAEWGGLDADGEWQDTRYLVTIVLTLVLTLAILQPLQATAKNNLARGIP